MSRRKKPWRCSGSSLSEIERSKDRGGQGHPRKQSDPRNQEEDRALLRFEVLLTAGALDDLDGIADYIAEYDSTENAGRVLYRLTKTVEGLAEFPERSCRQTIYLPKNADASTN